jgi:hypothetical protein
VYACVTFERIGAAHCKGNARFPKDLEHAAVENERFVMGSTGG